MGGLEDPAHCSIMESSGADAASLQVNPFHCQFFLNDLRFDQLYAFVSLFSLKSNFLSNDLGYNFKSRRVIVIVIVIVKYNNNIMTYFYTLMI